MSQAGKHFILGFSGKEPKPEFLHYLADTNIAAVILFRENIHSPKQLAALCQQLRSAAGEDLLIAIDQEGGRVTRTAKPFTQFPAANLVAKAAEAEGKEIVFEMGKVVGAELRACGVNWNFAPVLDIATNVFNPVIGDRSFSNDPKKVADLACEYIRGLETSFVMACGKHFPGHGDTNLDSHFTCPTLPHTRKRMDVCEFVPFKKAIELGISSLMTAHLNIPLLDRDEIMSTSRQVLTGILREEFRFGGLVVSDDLCMQGITSKYSMEEAAAKALYAGSDMLIIRGEFAHQQLAIRHVQQVINDGLIPADQLKQSAARIDALAKRYACHDLGADLSQVGSAEHKKLSKRFFEFDTAHPRHSLRTSFS